MTTHRINCATCNKTAYTKDGANPVGWALECDRCRAGSPGKPRKTVRHCSVCQEPIIVMGVPGGVRLMCPNCAKKDLRLVDVENITRERNHLLARVNDLEEHKDMMAAKLVQQQKNTDTMVAVALKDATMEIAALKLKLQERAEQTLAERLKAKMEMKHWQTKKETIREFLEWFQATHTDVDVDAVLRRYLDD